MFVVNASSPSCGKYMITRKIITSTTAVAPLRHLVTVTSKSIQPAGHIHHRRHSPHPRQPHPYHISGCLCGFSTSSHKERMDRPPLPRVISRVHTVTERLHENLPLAVASVSASLLASVPGLLPVVVAKTLVLGVYLGVGVPAVLHSVVAGLGSRQRAVKAILDVHSLMTLSAIAALVIGKATEGAFLLGLFQLAHAVQHRIIRRARKDVNRLADLVPDSVQVIRSDGSIASEMCSRISVGTRILVRPGSVCPIDGILASNSATVQLSHLTGEPANIEKASGTDIPAGAVNVSRHSMEVVTTRPASQSTLQRIVELAESAAVSRPKVASFIEDLAPRYSSAVLVGTGTLALAGPAVFGWTVTASLYTALSFLVAASPCALLVAAPVAQAAAVSACSRRGIVLSGGAAALERFATAQSIAVDKTGTLTEGKMHVVDIERVTGDSESAMEVAAVLARHGSTHPVSQGIARTVIDGKSRYRLITDSVTETAGESVCGSVLDTDDDVEWLVVISRYTDPASTYAGQSMSQIRVSSTHNEVHECIVRLEDEIRPGAREALAQASLPVYMLTGDNRESALMVAGKIGLDSGRVFAGMTPEDKARMVRQLSHAVMVGDGVNDAPALAAAPAGGVSVAASSSGDAIRSAAVSVADAVVMGDPHSSSPLHSVNFLIAKSKQTDRIVKTNVGIALTGMVGTALAVVAGGCPLWLAVVLHEGSTVVVVLNSLRNL